MSVWRDGQVVSICGEKGETVFSCDWATYIDSGSCTELLCYLKNRAQVFLGREVTDAMISVPCEWSLDFWKSIRDSAKKSGFRRVRLIPGPTAEAVRNAEQMRREGKEASFLQVEQEAEGMRLSLYCFEDNVLESGDVRYVREITREGILELAAAEEMTLASIGRVYVVGEETAVCKTDSLKVLTEIFGACTDVRYVKSDCAEGAAWMAARAVGMTESFLVLMSTPFSLGIIVAGASVVLADKALCIPLRRSIRLKGYDFVKKDLDRRDTGTGEISFFCQGQAAGRNWLVTGTHRFCGLLTRVGLEDTVELSMEIDADFHIQLRLRAEPFSEAMHYEKYDSISPLSAKMCRGYERRRIAEKA